MCVGLVLLLGMLTALSVGALTGLASYRRLVRELDFSIYEAPRRAELAEAVGSLFEPLLRTYPNTPQGADAQRRAFKGQLTATKNRLVDFHRRLDQLPPSKTTDEYKAQTAPVLEEMQKELAMLELQSDRLGDPETQPVVVNELLQQVARLETRAQKVPDFHSGLHESLSRAREIYRSRIRLVAWTSGIVLLLFLSFAYFVYAGILAPVQQLHQGALRVAEGDFDYQLDLPGRGEMSDLADAFNKMTARFQEIQQDLNRQVGERSRQLMRSERLAGIGFLSAGVAHEINNPLSAISMAAESLASRAALLADPDNPQDVQTVAKYLAMIRREAERCEQIVRRLLEFARGNDGRRERADLTQLVCEVLDMVRPMSKYRNRNIEFFRTQPCYAEVNGPEIKQVVLNIVSNALESTGDDETLRIRITEQTDSVALAFEDDGCGMSDEVLQHLFEPFFTRRKDGKGTGLGMAISQRIVSDHGGTLEAESAGEGRGSVFRVHLPRKAQGKAAAA